MTRHPVQAETRRFHCPADRRTGCPAATPRAVTPNRNPVLVAIATAAYVASQANLARLLGPLDPSIFALQLAFTPEQFWQVIEKWGPSGVSRYQSHFVYDFIHPFIYAALGYVWVRRTALFSALPRPAHRFFALALPVAGVCDLVENSIHVHLLRHDAGFGGQLVLLSGSASSIKWALAAIFTAALATLLLRAPWRR